MSEKTGSMDANLQGRLRAFYAKRIGIEAEDIHPAPIPLTEEFACAFVENETATLRARVAELASASEKAKHGHRGLVGELENTRTKLGFAEKRIAELEGALKDEEERHQGTLGLLEGADAQVLKQAAELERLREVVAHVSAEKFPEVRAAFEAIDRAPAQAEPQPERTPR